MTQLALPALAAPRATPRLPSAARVARYGAAATFAALGLGIAAVGISFPVVEGMIASGTVAPPQSELDAFASIAPLWGLFVAFGLLQIAGAAGSLEERRWGRVVALVAGVALLAVAVVPQVAVALDAASLDPAGRVLAVALSGLAAVLVIATVIGSADRR